MAHFLELHIKHSGEPIYISTNSIAYVEKSNGCAFVYFIHQGIASTSDAHGLSSISSYCQKIEVSESYSLIKMLIEE